MFFAEIAGRKINRTMKTALDPRHKNRQRTIQSLFAYNFKRQHLATDLAKQVVSNLEEIDKLIAQYAPEFPINRINPADLAVLRLAIYELVFDRSQPPKAIIDEAIELAKEFGGESSPSFINGVLGKVVRSPQRLLKIIADRLGADGNLTADTNLKADLNATDIEVADLLLYLEKDLGIIFPSNQQFTTVGDILEFLEDD